MLDTGSPREKLFLAIERQRLAHFYLFAGTDRNQKLTTAQQLVKKLHCSSNSKPCGDCISCRLVDDGKHLGFWLISRDDELKRKQSISIDSMRNLKRRLNHEKAEGGLIVFFKQADDLTTEAANSFLKLLEEAPEEVTFIFDVINPYRLLGTIRSRSQIIWFGHEESLETYGEILPNVPVDQFWETLQNMNGGALCLLIEKSSPDRMQLLDRYCEFQSWLLQAFRTSADARLQMALERVRHYQGLLERPVQAVTNLLLLTLDLKGIIKE